MPAETHRTLGSVGRPEVAELVRERLAEVLDVDPGGVHGGATLRDDLGADDLALLDLLDGLEEDLGERTVGLAVDPEELHELATVADLVDSVVAALDAPAGDVSDPASPHAPARGGDEA